MKSRLTRIPQQSLADQAKDQIRQAIFEGKIKPAERLTIERIAAELGISRTPIREALKSLEADGIVQLLPNRGAVVQRFSRDELYERYSVRALLEGYCGELACRVGDEKLAGVLEENCAVLDRTLLQVDRDDLDDVSALLKLNTQFHDSILAASGNVTANRILDSLRMPIAFRLYHWRDKERQRVSLDFHRRIAAAFRAQKPRQARRLLEAHILETRDFLMASE